MSIHSNIPSENSITPATNILTGSLRTIFEHSDYNVLINNIPGARQSSYYFDVDYSYDAFRPVNLNLILSQSAAIAVVQDSNYTSKRIISSRYQGSKTISARYNYYTPLSSNATFEDGRISNWVGDDSYGQTAAIDLHTPFFGYFEEVKDAFPKASLGSKVVLSKLIDKNGKIIPLDGRNINLFDVSNIFKPNKKAFIYYTESTSESFSNIQNVLTKSVDESGFLYTTLAFYKPTQTDPSILGDPFTNQEDNKLFYSILDTRAVSGVYIDKEMYGYNSLLAQNNIPPEYNRLYFYYGIPDSSSLTGAPASPFRSTGYFLGMGLILRNFYPGTGEQYESYRQYPWIRFEHISGGAQNYNININTDLLPLEIGDRFRIYDATEASFSEVYSYDKDIFFIQNASGSGIRYTLYDSEITDIQFTLPTTINFLTATDSSSILNENFFIGSNSASIYTTSDRFATIGNIFPISSSTRIFPAENLNGIDITPGPFVPAQHDETYGYGVSFKKLYKIKDFSLFGPSGASAKYPYWGIGTSGSLFRSKNNLVFEQVNLSLSPSCSLNSMFILPDSEISSDTNIDYFSNPHISYKYSYKRGYIFVVGDSGSIFYSSDFGNTFTKSTFPRNDIHLKDVYYFKSNQQFPGTSPPLTTDFLMVVGTSGSIYITSGSSTTTQFTGGSVIYSNIDPVIDSNWGSVFAYGTFFEYFNGSISYPTQLKRENLSFTRLIPITCTTAADDINSDITNFLILSDSGSIFYPSIFSDNSTVYENGNSNLSELNLYPGSSIYNYISPATASLFPTSSNLIDRIVTGALYDSIFDQINNINKVQVLFLDRNGRVYFNSSIIPGLNLNEMNSSLIYSNVVESPFNELRNLNSINYDTNLLEPHCWIPTSTGLLLSQSLVNALQVGTQTWGIVDPALYFSYISSSFGRVEPHDSFYSMIDVNDYNPYNPFNSLYVQLTFRDLFNQGFYNPIGSSVYPYGVNSGFSNYIQNGNFTGTRQAFRFYRRYSNEQYVLTKEFVNDGKGFIIPENYDPKLNYIELAKKAGLLI